MPLSAAGGSIYERGSHKYSTNFSQSATRAEDQRAHAAASTRQKLQSLTGVIDQIDVQEKQLSNGTTREQQFAKRDERRVRKEAEVNWIAGLDDKYKAVARAKVEAEIRQKRRTATITAIMRIML